MDILIESARGKGSSVVVGLDPDVRRLPSQLLQAYSEVEAVSVFCRGILEAVEHEAAAVKVQSAYFERLGPAGMEAYARVIRDADEMGLPVIADVKRGDIGPVAAAYAEAHLRVYGAGAVTVNPYMGSDAVMPFLDEVRRLGRGGGVFVLATTSNPSAKQIQGSTEPPVVELVSRMISELGMPGAGGYLDAGAVVGITNPQSGRRVRELLPDALFLSPGYGAQGGGIEGVQALLDATGGGVLVNSSRGIIYAWEMTGGDYRTAARDAARHMREELLAAGVCT